MWPLFNVNASGSSLTIGQNIRLAGTSTQSSINVINGNLIMLAGSRITGRALVTAAVGAVNVTGANANFIMHGGAITSNFRGSTRDIPADVLIAANAGGFTQNGGTIGILIDERP